MPLTFQWDTGNTRHIVDEYPERGNTINEIESLFVDPAFSLLPDRIDSRGEQQYHSVGHSNQSRLLYVVFSIRMKLDPLVVGQPAEKNATVMLKSSSNKETKIQATNPPKTKAIRNGHMAVELAESGERWATYEGRYMTLEKVLAVEAAKQKQPD